MEGLRGFVFPTENTLDMGVPAKIAAASIAMRSKAKRSTSALTQVGVIDGRHCQGYRVYDPLGIGPAVTASGGGKIRFSGAYLVEGGARSLTPRKCIACRECASWSSWHDVHVYVMRHVGNGVAISVVRKLERQLADRALAPPD